MANTPPACSLPRRTPRATAEISAELARADARRDEAERDGVAHERQRVREEIARIYVRWMDYIDPASAEGCARTGFLLLHVSRSERRVEALFQLAADVAPDPDVRSLAMVAAASFAISAQRLPEAHRLLTEALRRTRGSGSRTERAACVNLARALLEDSRPQEALILSGRALTLAEAIDEDLGIAAAMVTGADALCALGDAQEALERLAVAATHLAVTTGPSAASIESRAAFVKLRALRGVGRYDEALALLDRLAAGIGDPTDSARAWWCCFRADVSLDARDPGAADAALAAAHEALGPGSHRGFRLVLLDARLAHARGERSEALRHCHDALQQAEGPQPLPSDERFSIAELAPILEDLGDADAARRCIELAAAERLEQIVAIDRCARDLPEVCVVRREDRDLLVRARNRFLDQERELLEILARLLVAPPEGASAGAALLRPDAGDVIRVCAWCTRVGISDGTWLPLGHLLAPSGAFRITHGICAECRDGASQEYPRENA